MFKALNGITLNIVKIIEPRVLRILNLLTTEFLRSLIRVKHGVKTDFFNSLKNLLHFSRHQYKWSIYSSFAKELPST